MCYISKITTIKKMILQCNKWSINVIEMNCRRQSERDITIIVTNIGSPE